VSPRERAQLWLLALCLAASALLVARNRAQEAQALRLRAAEARERLIVETVAARRPPSSHTAKLERSIAMLIAQGSAPEPGTATADEDSERGAAAPLGPPPPVLPTIYAPEPGAGVVPGDGARGSEEAERDRIRHETIESERRERALRLARRHVAITLYATSWCGPCRRASAYMSAAGLSFREYDIEQDEVAKAAQRRLNPRGSVPTIDVDGEVMIGWDSRRFEAMLDAAAQNRVLHR
jgi:mycoredoxin